MILGFHLIITTYGFWLPNAESGSGSDFVRADHLTKFGPANPVSRRRSVAYNPFDVEIRKMARASLDYDPVEFTGRQALSVGTGFGNEIRAYGGTMYACSILPNHVHQVVGPHRYDVRRFAGRLKGAATKQLRADGLHPFEGLRDRAGGRFRLPGRAFRGSFTCGRRRTCGARSATWSRIR